MNSLLNQTSHSETRPNEDFLNSFEKSLLEMKDLTEVEKLMNKLQFLGLNFDPFQGIVGNESEQILDQLGLKEHLRDPYSATNIILRLLDKTEERLNNLKQ
jgi:hypothetical protein